MEQKRTTKLDFQELKELVSLVSDSSINNEALGRAFVVALYREFKPSQKIISTGRKPETLHEFYGILKKIRSGRLARVFRESPSGNTLFAEELRAVNQAGADSSYAHLDKKSLLELFYLHFSNFPLQGSFIRQTIAAYNPRESLGDFRKYVEGRFIQDLSYTIEKITTD